MFFLRPCLGVYWTRASQPFVTDNPPLIVKKYTLRTIFLNTCKNEHRMTKKGEMTLIHWAVYICVMTITTYDQININVL